MHVALYTYLGNARHHALPELQAFAAGLQRHGIEPIWRDVGGSPELDCDLAVIWGHRASEVIAHQRRTGRRYLVLERGYVGDRNEWTSAGFDGLNGRADFSYADGLPGGRWEEHFGLWLWPWRGAAGEYVLLIGQVARDAATAHVDLARWYAETAATAHRLHGLPVRFRPHPLSKAVETVPGTETAHGSLYDAFGRAALVITFNSNAGVLAALAGVPVVALDEGSMAWPVAGHAIETVCRPPRQRWAEKLAWCQWRTEEFRSGEAWERLRVGMEAPCR